MVDDTNANEELTKVLIDLPNHWRLKGESFWAKPLGGDRYALQNVPPEVDLDALRDHLDALELADVLFYETCEERVPGSFDDRPGEPGGAT